MILTILGLISLTSFLQADQKEEDWWEFVRKTVTIENCDSSAKTTSGVVNVEAYENCRIANALTLLAIKYHS